VELTIDALIQDKVERVLADVGQTYRPKGARRSS
jgi:cell division protein FtsI/penicillin-binding protein 2